jgi:hypothetical protein
MSRERVPIPNFFVGDWVEMQTPEGLGDAKENTKLKCGSMALAVSFATQVPGGEAMTPTILMKQIRENTEKVRKEHPDVDHGWQNNNYTEEQLSACARSVGFALGIWDTVAKKSFLPLDMDLPLPIIVIFHKPDHWSGCRRQDYKIPASVFNPIPYGNLELDKTQRTRATNYAQAMIKQYRSGSVTRPTDDEQEAERCKKRGLTADADLYANYEFGYKDFEVTPAEEAALWEEWAQHFLNHNVYRSSRHFCFHWYGYFGGMRLGKLQGVTLEEMASARDTAYFRYQANILAEDARNRYPQVPADLTAHSSRLLDTYVNREITIPKLMREVNKVKEHPTRTLSSNSFISGQPELQKDFFNQYLWVLQRSAKKNTFILSTDVWDLLDNTYYNWREPKQVLRIAGELSSLPTNTAPIENMIIPCVDFASQTGTIVNVNIQKSTITVFQDMAKISPDFRNCICAFVRAVAEDDDIEWDFEAFERPPCNARWELTLLLDQVSAIVDMVGLRQANIVTNEDYTNACMQRFSDHIIVGLLKSKR